MPWTISSEIYPLWARSFCYSVSTSFNWFFNLLVSLTFLTLTRVLSNHGAYYLYASIAFIGWLLFFVFLPETKGKSLEEIELLFQEPLFTLSKKKRTRPEHTNHAHTNSSAESISTAATSIRAWAIYEKIFQFCDHIILKTKVPHANWKPKIRLSTL